MENISKRLQNRDKNRTFHTQKTIFSDFPNRQTAFTEMHKRGRETSKERQISVNTPCKSESMNLKCRRKTNEHHITTD